MRRRFRPTMKFHDETTRRETVGGSGMVDDGDRDLTLSSIRLGWGRGHAEGRIYAGWELIQTATELYVLEHPERFAAFRRGFETCFVDIRRPGHLLDATVEIRMVNNRERGTRVVVRWAPRLRMLPTSFGAAAHDLRIFVMLLSTTRLLRTS